MLLNLYLFAGNKWLIRSRRNSYLVFRLVKLSNVHLIKCPLNQDEMKLKDQIFYPTCYFTTWHKIINQNLESNRDYIFGLGEYHIFLVIQNYCSFMVLISIVKTRTFTLIFFNYLLDDWIIRSQIVFKIWFSCSKLHFYQILYNI